MLTGTGRAYGVSPALRVVPSGEWYSVVLQLFPDGRCGAAVDGEPVAVTGPHALPSDSLYVSFFGNSVGTRPLVGQTTASVGVARDINWEAVPRPPVPRPPH